MPLNPFSAAFVDFMINRFGGLVLLSFSPSVVVSIVFLALALWGVLSLARARKAGLLILLVLPVVTHLVLSAAQLYPFFHRLVL